MLTPYAVIIPKKVAKCKTCGGSLRYVAEAKLVLCDECNVGAYPPASITQYIEDTLGGENKCR